ncbi:hypothetical protein GCE86_09005 [Micromonospora terminaliae]|uniref:Uncharacterized protein n=1 Tax=Micromonospora terminaliae TaxID=1914461 RepID=A0AAJ2ZEJ5_9ACTN|nr:hypothetical protein [Micromonospora terminaliae]NES28076.1 hypothetical protein [Micromonospora terminaliae]QGL47173.1 hypothetical protein GCE86_09005 [Micromonospora terminaliae]
MDDSRLPTSDLANAYAQVAGILAGFAFVSLGNYLASGQRSSEEDSEGVLVRRISTTLFSAFAALVLISVLYALLTGEKDGTTRANTALIIAGLPFGLSVLTLFFALTLMASDRGFKEVVRLGLILVVLIGPAIVHLRLMNALAAVDPRSNERLSPFYVGIRLTVVLMIAASAAWAMASWRRRRRGDHTAPIATLATSHASLVTAVVAAVLSSVVIAKPEAYRPPRVMLYLIAVGMFLLLAVFATCAALAIHGADALRRVQPSATRESKAKEASGATEPTHTLSPISEEIPTNRIILSLEWRSGRFKRKG